MADETTPLLNGDAGSDPHSQFCVLVGIPPNGKPTKHLDPTTLYPRVLDKHKNQNFTYNFTAALSNTLLLSQIVLGATLTALGASESSHVLITIFGVLNTVIAGLVAYLKSRGQPMRARIFRDDLEHVVDEIENSKIMWLGVTKDILGYDEIDIDDKVSVRSEVARLTRLYESAIKKYKQNSPDLYSMGGGVLDPITGLRARPGPGTQLPPAVSASGAPAPAAPGPATSSEPVADADESPATAKVGVKADAKDDAKPDDAKKDEGAGDDKPGDKATDDKGKEKEDESRDSKPDTAHGDKPSGSDSKGSGSGTGKPNANEDADDDAEPASAADPSKITDSSGPGPGPDKPKDETNEDRKKPSS